MPKLLPTLLIIAILATIGVFWVHQHAQTPQPTPEPAVVAEITQEDEEFEQTDTRPTVILGNETFYVDIVLKEADRARGLSGRSGLATNEGLWFVFEEPARHAFWMKDMLFAIDIIWIDINGLVVHIEHGLTPETFPTIFTPSSDASYVLEVNSGTAERLSVSVGSVVTLPSEVVNIDN